MTTKARIAHLAGPNATIQNTPPLVTSNKVRAKYGLERRVNPDGSPQRKRPFQHLRDSRFSVLIEQFREKWFGNRLRESGTHYRRFATLRGHFPAARSFAGRRNLAW